MVISIHNHDCLNYYSCNFHMAFHYCINQENLNNTILIIFIRFQPILISYLSLSNTSISCNHHPIITDIINIYLLALIRISLVCITIIVSLVLTNLPCNF